VHPFCVKIQANINEIQANPDPPTPSATDGQAPAFTFFNVISNAKSREIPLLMPTFIHQFFNLACKELRKVDVFQ
jgi:hypothetical protein